MIGTSFNKIRVKIIVCVDDDIVYILIYVSFTMLTAPVRPCLYHQLNVNPFPKVVDRQIDRTIDWVCP